MFFIGETKVFGSPEKCVELASFVSGSLSRRNSNMKYELSKQLG